MADFGRSIRIYLADGTPSGIRHVEIVNWSGQAIWAPKSRFIELSQWEEVKKPGVYFLFERQSSDTESKVYIGESENVFNRLGDHYKNKDFWNELVVFSSKDENLTKSHIKYLESRLVQIAVDAKRYIVENSNSPTQSTLPRADRDAMEEFVHNMKIILGTLGHKVLEPIKLNEVPVLTNNNTLVGVSLTFVIKNLKAIGQITDDGFLLLEGSDISREVAPSIPSNIRSLREKLISDSSIIDNGANLKANKNLLFSSSSAAAALVAGTSRSGPQSWQDNQGKTLKVLEEQILQSINQP